MTIYEAMGAPAMMNQIAEECCELGQAALKYRRTLENDSPTPIGQKAAWAHLLEEVSNIMLCINELPVKDDDAKIVIRQMVLKKARWKKRLGIEDEKKPEKEEEKTGEPVEAEKKETEPEGTEAKV